MTLMNHHQMVFKNDVFSFQILAYEITSGNDVYCEYGDEVNSIEFKDKIISGIRPQFDDHFLVQLKSIISKCWNNKN